MVSSQGFSTETQCSVVFCCREGKRRTRRERTRARAREREGDPERLWRSGVGRGGAGRGGSRGIQCNPPLRAENLSVLCFFFCPTGFSALNPGTYLCGLLFFISFFCSECVCVLLEVSCFFVVLPSIMNS